MRTDQFSTEMAKAKPFNAAAKPEFGTVVKVLHALGIDLIAQPQGSKAA